MQPDINNRSELRLTAPAFCFVPSDNADTRSFEGETIDPLITETVLDGGVRSQDYNCPITQCSGRLVAGNCYNGGSIRLNGH